MHTNPHPGSFASLCLVCAALVPLPAWGADVATDAEPRDRPRRFGDAGTLAVSGASSLSFTRTEVTGGSSTPSTSFFVSPGVDWFPVRGLSLGVRAGYGHQAAPGYPDADSLSVGPRVGYDVTLGDHWSLWPQVYGASGATWGSDGSRAVAWSAGAYVPALYHPAPHVFLGLGPTVVTTYFPAMGNGSQEVTPSVTLTTYGLLATLGGWVGL